MKPLKLTLYRQQHYGLGYPAERMPSTFARTEQFIQRWAPRPWIVDRLAPIDRLVAAAQAERTPLAVSIFFCCMFEAIHAAMRDVRSHDLEPATSSALLTALEQELIRVADARASEQRPDVPLAVIRQRTGPSNGEKYTGADFGWIVHTRDADGEFIKGIYVQAKRADRESAEVDYCPQNSPLQLDTLCSHGEGVGHYLFYNMPQREDARDAVPPFTMASALDVADAFRTAQSPSRLPLANLTTEATVYLALGLMHRDSPVGKLFADPETAVAEMVKPFPDPEAAQERLWVVQIDADSPNPIHWLHYLQQYAIRATPPTQAVAESTADEAGGTSCRM